MNNRIRQQSRALIKQAQAEAQADRSIMAILKDEEGSPWSQIVFVQPDEWKHVKQIYGTRLEPFFKELEPKEE